MTVDPPTPIVIPRLGRGTQGATESGRSRALQWSEVVDRLAQAGVYWLTTVAPTGAPHVRPLFAKWCDESLYVTSNPSSVKARHLASEPRCVIAADTGDAHVAIEAVAVHVDDADELRLVADALRAGGWPTEVDGDRLDAPFGAPTSGGPPYHVYRLEPRRCHAFPADGESFAPTRFVFSQFD